MKIGHLLSSFLLTLLILIGLEILSMTVVPQMGFERYRFAVNALFVIYIAIKLNVSYIAILVFGIQIVHSLFSIEGWAIGTFVGLLICFLVERLKDLLHLNTYWFSVLVIQLLQIVWFLLESVILYVKMDNFQMLMSRFFYFLPESLLLSFTAPLLFALLDKVWRIKGSAIEVEA